MTSLTTDPRRPSEIVRAYLKNEFTKPDVLSGTRLPSIKVLSRHLKVSPSTVQTVLSEWTEEGKVRSVHGSGIYFVKSERAGEESRVVTINIDPGQIVPTNAWAGLIAMGVLNELSHGKYRTLLRSAKPGTRPVEEECQESHGAILFAHDKAGAEFQNAFESAGKPAVFINPPAVNATSNFVSTDYFRNARRLAEAWIATGRNHICLILHSNPGKSLGALLTLTGFTAAVEAAAPERRIKFTYRQLPELDEVEAAQFFDCLKKENNELPDALYFFSPISAETMVSELRARGVSVPEQISVAAGTSEERLSVHRLNLTVFAQSLDRLGAEGARMLFWRWDHANQPAPGRYVPCRFVAGATTRDEENLHVQASETNP